MDDEKGIVYVLTNPAMPGLVKIGKTTRDSIDVRMRELYGTGVPVPFRCEYACKVNLEACDAIETALHTAFAPDRVNENREFFKIDPAQAIAVLKLFQVDGASDATAEVIREIDDDLTPADQAGEGLRRKKRPPLNFSEMNIPVGSILQYTDDETVQVTVLDERHVEYDGERTSLTATIRKLKDLDISIQPTKFWTYNGKNLQDIYDETYPFEDD